MVAPFAMRDAGDLPCVCVVVRRWGSRAPLNLIMVMVMVMVGVVVASDFEHVARLLLFLVSTSKHQGTSQQCVLAALNSETMYESSVGQHIGWGGAGGEALGWWCADTLTR